MTASVAVVEHGLSERAMHRKTVEHTRTHVPTDRWDTVPSRRELARNEPLDGGTQAVSTHRNSLDMRIEACDYGLASRDRVFD